MASLSQVPGLLGVVGVAVSPAPAIVCPALPLLERYSRQLPSACCVTGVLMECIATA
jgi:hypothetical protein